MVIFAYINKKYIYFTKALQVPSMFIEYLVDKRCFDFLNLAAGTEIFYLQALRI